MKIKIDQSYVLGCSLFLLFLLLVGVIILTLPPKKTQIDQTEIPTHPAVFSTVVPTAGYATSVYNPTP